MPPNISREESFKIVAATLFITFASILALLFFQASGVAIMLTVVLSLVCVFTFWRLRRVDVAENNWSIQLSGLTVRFSYEELRVATKDFTEKLGSGGFGSVFKGMLEDGTVVAVKRLDKLGRDKNEFTAEVKSIGRIHHINLVRLIGYCADKSSQLLVYEFMVNGSLDTWIFNRDKNQCLNWATRKSIAVGIARGLAYLHQGCHKRILHLDIKPANILLDENFNARISDFGLSELIDRDKSQVLATIRGTPGYIPPERLRRITTVSADTYSFGMVLLEMICGRRNVNCHSNSSSHLLRLLQKKSEENRLLDILENFDQEVQNHAEEVERMIKLAAWCLQSDYNRRPSMSTVVMVLEGAMEVEPDLCFNFSFALEDHVLDICHDTPAPKDSVLSGPR